ncbi:MAG: class I mannose-6-phosphate isomerase [Phycisphaerae bacterium]|nr:class I mannose-6-phosphate isomerase [Phycisphaerae bacterium]
MNPNAYPFIFTPIYKDKIWGGRNLARLYGRSLPVGKNIGESWELADLAEGVSVLRNGPAAGRSLTELTRELGRDLLGDAKPMPDGRFPLLLKLLDAEDILSLQVHPDEQAVAEIGPPAALKTECWYILESRQGFVYKGVKPGVTAEAFQGAIERDDPAALCTRFDVAGGDFHFLPAGTVHALGSGVVVAEVQTPSDTTYRVSDWGRGREVHVAMSMRCIRFDLRDGRPPGGDGDVLLTTPYFSVARRTVEANTPLPLPAGRCRAIMITAAAAPVTLSHAGGVEPTVQARNGDTILLPACLTNPRIACAGRAEFLDVTLPE